MTKSMFSISLTVLSFVLLLSINQEASTVDMSDVTSKTTPVDAASDLTARNRAHFE